MTVKYNKISTKIIVLLLAVEILSMSLLPKLMPIPPVIFQLFLYGILASAIIMFLQGVRVEWRMLLVVVAAGMSLILSNANAKYNAPARLATWILLISMVGPLFYNSVLVRFRNKLFEITLYTFMIIGGISFLYWAIGLPNLGRGHFSGVMGHSMLLAPIVSLGGIYAFYRFLSSRSWRSKFIFVALFIFSVIDALLAVSRASFVGFMFGLMILIFFNKFKYKKVIMSIIAISTFVVAINMNDTDTYASSRDSILSEMQSRGLENTREVLWDARIAEFKANPVFGVGFASQDEKLIVGKIGSDEGNIEPGSTYLSVLSMMGIVGAFTVILFLLKPLLSRKYWKRMISSKSYMLASYAFFSVHFLAEGYIFASGSLFAFVFWTLVGATYPYTGINYNKVSEGR